MSAQRRLPLRFGTAPGLAFALFFLWGCGSEAPRETYYEREIEPILLASCAGNTAGCHVASDDDPFAFAAGGFDVTSFERVQKRGDLLRRFGAYEVPLLLTKAVGDSGQLGFSYRGDYRPLEVQHAGGGVMSVGSDAYLTLLEWTENGATENGLPPATPAATGSGRCSPYVPGDYDTRAAVAEPSFARFRDEIQPIIKSCGAGSCHGAPQADFYISCGDDERQVAFNYSQARAFVAPDAAESPLLQVPLAVAAGGYFHSGGDHFEDRDDADYLAVKAWAEESGALAFGADDAGRAFFADNVQPLLLARGCSFEACHSPQSTNDFQLRSGSQGFFSAIALERNYEKLRDHFMALEVPDARRGRAVAKTILQSGGGIAHRGGPLLETPGAGPSDPENCPPGADPTELSAFCIIQRWVDIERESLLRAGAILPLGAGDSAALVYVERQETHVASPLEFDTYQPGSDLKSAPAFFDSSGGIESVGEAASLLDACPGAANRAAVDVSGPDVHPNGRSIVFSMRLSAAEGRQLYRVALDGSDCRRLTSPESAVGGVLIHHFDPAWSVDGESIVYASTRGSDGPNPQPSLSRALFLPQSDLFRMKSDGSGAERITFLTNSEISPQMMREGRIIMTTEKVSEDFYQLSGRRLNWDLTDYHPLLGQRAISPYADLDDPSETRPSVDYQQATEIRENLDGNFLVIFSDRGARGGAGALATFNRSVGTFEATRQDPGFLESVQIVDPAARGRVGELAEGAYRSPSPLPGGQILASYARPGADLKTVTRLDFDLVAVDPHSGSRKVLVGGPGAAVEAVLALPRPLGRPYQNRRQLVFGGEKNSARTGGDAFAVMHFPDAPLIFTLLNANLRRGRPAYLFREATHLAVFAEASAPPSAAGRSDIFERRELLGRVALDDDGSAKVRVPSGQSLVLELQTDAGDAVETMREEHQLGPGEYITFGVAAPLFDAVCAGCHGSLSGREIDTFVTPDALTGASQSLSLEEEPADLR